MKLSLFSLCVFVVLVGHAQKVGSVVRGYAYFTVPIPGTIMVDDSGKEIPPPRTKVYAIYLEVKGAAPQWTKAWVDGKSFTLTTVPVSSGSVDVGKRYADERPVILKASKQNTLIQLEFSPDQKPQPAPQKMGNEELLIGGRFKGKSFYYKISGIVELASPQYQ